MVFHMSAPLISVITPTRHEEATIGAFLRRVAVTLDSTPFEVLVVDDSDDDNTLGVLLQVQRELGAERVIVLHRPRGSVAERTLGTAVLTGIRAAHGTYVCVIGADAQHPPEIIAEMVAAAQRTGADYVGASRYMPGGSAEGPEGFSRKAISLGLALLTRLTFVGTPIRCLTDPLSRFFLFRRALVDDVPLKAVGWKISLKVLVRSRARHVVEVPYTLVCRADGSSKASVSQRLVVLRHILVLFLSLRFVRFGLVGVSGVLVNTGGLLLFAALGFNAVAWPIWVTTELAILWNYMLNKRMTWGDRQFGSWWAYNLAALGSSLIAIAATTLLVNICLVWLGLASLLGIALGMLLNYLVLDRVVFACAANRFSWQSLRAFS